MKEHPILFSPPMVQAILAGRKTMTRRIIKPQPPDDIFETGLYCPTMVDRHGEEYPGSERYGISNEAWSIKFPYGQPGDKLWVRETFQIVPPNFIFYKADPENKAKTGWKPSIFMPRSASRIDLVIKSVRVERLNDISNTDALNEGIERKIKFPDEEPDTLFYRDYSFKRERFARGILFGPKESFKTLWESINGKESWQSNPWAWCIIFERIYG
jgi:hypothetical protein